MEVSFGEMIALLVIAFVVLGPKEMLVWSQKLGRLVGQLRAEVNNFKIMAETQVLEPKKRDLESIEDTSQRAEDWELSNDGKKTPTKPS